MVEQTEVWRIPKIGEHTEFGGRLEWGNRREKAEQNTTTSIRWSHKYERQQWMFDVNLFEQNIVNWSSGIRSKKRIQWLRSISIEAR